jgi:hypothetical protein
MPDKIPHFADLTKYDNFVPACGLCPCFERFASRDKMVRKGEASVLSWKGFITIDGHEVSVKVYPEQQKPGQVLTRRNGVVENPSPELQQLISQSLTGKAGPHIFPTRIGQIFFTGFIKFQFAGPPTFPDEE